MPMPVKISESELPGVLLVEAGIARDERGYFVETYSAKTFAEGGLESRFIQDNLSASRRGTVRGLHYQLEPHGMGKLVRAFTGAIFDVAVDLRRGSPTFGRWIGRELTPENRLALFIPSGFAHGFVALADDTLVHYKCTAIHTPEAERSIHYADPDLAITWPMTPSLVSAKDAAAPRFRDAEHNFEYKSG